MQATRVRETEAQASDAGYKLRSELQQANEVLQSASQGEARLEISEGERLYANARAGLTAAIEGTGVQRRYIDSLRQHATGVMATNAHLEHVANKLYERALHLESQGPTFTNEVGALLQQRAQYDEKFSEAAKVWDRRHAMTQEVIDGLRGELAASKQVEPQRDSVPLHGFLELRDSLMKQIHEVARQRGEYRAERYQAEVRVRSLLDEICNQDEIINDLQSEWVANQPPEQDGKDDEWTSVYEARVSAVEASLAEANPLYKMVWRVTMTPQRMRRGHAPVWAPAAAGRARPPTAGAPSDS